MKAALLFPLLTLMNGWSGASGAFYDPIVEDSRLDFLGLVRKNGYPVERHQVTTIDGYILTLHRIPYGVNCGSGQGEKIPVLLIHGILANSFSWILTGPQKSLGYILADNCYDVWLGNSRGTNESSGHKTLSRFSPNYWDFSWHEMGAYDLPAFIQYILTQTNKENLHYIGHSQGTTMFFVFNSLYPQYSKWIRSFQALAPVAYVGHMRSPLVSLTLPLSGITGSITSNFGSNGLLPVNRVFGEFGRQLCRNQNTFGNLLCSNIIFLFGGVNPPQLNTSLLPFIASHFPDGASVKQLIHYGQNIRSDTFRQFDYSLFFNPLRYGSLQPPSYNLKNVLTPVALHYSLNDWFVDVRDLNRLAAELPNVIGKFLVPLSEFSHLDFQWAIDVKPLLYDRVLDIMKKY